MDKQQTNESTKPCNTIGGGRQGGEDPPGAYFMAFSPPDAEWMSTGGDEGEERFYTAHRNDQREVSGEQRSTGTDTEASSSATNNSNNIAGEIVTTAEAVNLQAEQERLRRMAEQEALRIDPDLQRRVREAESTLEQLEQQPTVHAIQVRMEHEDQEEGNSVSPPQANDTNENDATPDIVGEESLDTENSLLPKFLSSRRGTAVVFVLLLVTAAVTIISLVIGNRDSSFSSPEGGTLSDTNSESKDSTPSPVPFDAHFLLDVVAREDDLATLQTNLEAAGLMDFLVTPQSESFTVFAPTNEAFAKFDRNLLAKLSKTEWKLHLQELLKLHISPGVVLIDDIADQMTFRTLTWPSEEVRATVTETREVSFESGPFMFTFKGVFSGSNVVQADLLADNGIIHKVDQVFLPTVLTLNLLEAAAELHPIFRELVVTAGIDERMSTDTLTLFGPWYYKFEDFFADRPEKRADPKFVKTLMESHAVEGVWDADRLTLGRTFTTIAGNTLTIEKTATGRLSVNGVTIDFADGVAMNGFIHVVSDVIIPEGLV